MSAFVVSPEHIKELAAFAASESPRNMSIRVDPRYLSYHISEGLKAQLLDEDGNHLVGGDLATVYAGVLYSENIRSVQHRYPDDETLDDLPGLIKKPGFISVSRSDVRFREVTNPVHILKMCSCLAYQSCETEHAPFKKIVRFTRGRYLYTTEPMGPFNFRYAVFHNQASEVLIPLHDLTPETKEAIKKIDSEKEENNAEAQ